MAAVGNLGLKKIIKGWDINADASYAQNVQSSIALFTTSNFNFGAYVRRRFGEYTYWTASAGMCNRESPNSPATVRAVTPS